MWLMPECPYCGKFETGEIRPTESFSSKGENDIKRINAKKGIRIYFTDVNEYKFLKSCNMNYYCFSCNRPFNGEAVKDYTLDGEEKEDYLKESGIKREQNNIDMEEYKGKKPGFIKKIIGILF